MSGLGSLMRWRADCGHWMTVWAKAPTPTGCPDCVEKLRRELLSAIDDGDDVDDLVDAIPGLPKAFWDDFCEPLAEIADARDAIAEAETRQFCAEETAAKILDRYIPMPERLVMPS